MSSRRKKKIVMTQCDNDSAYFEAFFLLYCNNEEKINDTNVITVIKKERVLASCSFFLNLVVANAARAISLWKCGIISLLPKRLVVLPKN